MIDCMSVSAAAKEANERRLERDIDAKAARIASLEHRVAELEADANRYIWLIAHTGRIDDAVARWKPGFHDDLLRFVQTYIDAEIPKAGKGWVDRQRKLLRRETSQEEQKP
jgi:hypothetical protein